MLLNRIKIINFEIRNFSFNIWLIITPIPCISPKITNNHEGPCHRPDIKKQLIL